MVAQAYNGGLELSPSGICGHGQGWGKAYNGGLELSPSGICGHGQGCRKAQRLLVVSKQAVVYK